ncbi:MAG TPA: AcvB/VirJ family lysyl-phosphatidylglycerol hydrolase [Gemmatimonadaceae bacterium]
MTSKRSWIAALALCSATAELRAQSPAEAGDVSQLPAVAVPAHDSGSTFAILLSGDGGWADIDKRIAGRLSQHGVPVIGLNLRDYLKTKRTPDEIAAAVSSLAHSYGPRWHRSHVILVGFSRGANLAPFAVTRLAPDVRAELRGMALIGLNRAANFKWHLQDVFRDVTRDDDVPTLPELAQIHDLPIVCVYGRDEHESGCLGTSPDVKRVERKGGHHLDGDFEAVADIIRDALVRP